MKHNTPILLDKVNNNADRLGRTESVREVTEVHASCEPDQLSAVDTIPTWCNRRACSSTDFK